MINNQPPERRTENIYGKLDIHSIFQTIQGEGPYVGRPAMFIRLAGCNLQCPLCDTDYTVGRKTMGVLEIVKKTIDLAAPYSIAVITGGEPFRQDITALCLSLIDAGFRVQIETNGTLPVSVILGSTVDIVCSPKAGKIHPTIKKWAMSYKYVLRAGNISPIDGLPLNALAHPAKPMVARPPSHIHPRQIYVQPVDEQDARKNHDNLQAAKNSCLEFGYTLGLQIHKLIGVN